MDKFIFNKAFIIWMYIDCRFFGCETVKYKDAYIFFFDKEWTNFWKISQNSPMEIRVIKRVWKIW